MKYLSIFLLFCLFTLPCFSQNENTIKLGSEVTLTLSKTGSSSFTYKITEVKKFDETIDLTNNDILKKDIDTGQVKLYFGKGKFGYDMKTVLIIKNGLKTPLKYTANIKMLGSDVFEGTSVNPLFPNVKSVEVWPYKITEIVLSDFSTMTY